MEYRKVSACSYKYWREKVLLIYSFLASFILTLFGKPPKQSFGHSRGSYDYKKYDGSKPDDGRPHGWGGGGYKELKDIQPCFSGG